MLHGPQVEYPERDPLELIRARAKRKPSKIAVVKPGGVSLTYGELDLSNLSTLVHSVSPALWAKYTFCNHYGGFDDPVYITVTSGSTGKPKRAFKTYRNLMSRIAWEQPGELDLPLVYPHGLPRLIVPLVAGVPCAVMDDTPLGLTATLAQIAELGATHITMWAYLLPRILKSKTDLNKVRELIAIGSPLDPEHAAQFREAWPHITLVNGYGSTEAGYCMRDWKPVPNAAVWVEDGKGNELPQRTPGLLAISGPGVSPCYVGQDTGGGASGFRVSPTGRNVFRSLDVARELPNGTIELIRRLPSR